MLNRVKFKVYNPIGLNISAKIYQEIKNINNIYIPFISDTTHIKDLNSFIYIIDIEPLKTTAIKELTKKGVNVTPMKTALLNETQEDLYVSEEELKKFIHKVKQSVEIKIGDIVKVQEYKNLPLRVIKIEKDRVTLTHKLKDMEVKTIVNKGVCEVIKEEEAIFYQHQHKNNPTAKLFVDGDIYIGEDTDLQLFNDLFTIKQIHNQYEPIIVNPYQAQKELADILGFKVMYGDFRVLPKTKHFDKDIDLLYTYNHYFLIHTHQILTLVKHENMSLPKLITKTTSNLDFKKIKMFNTNTKITVSNTKQIPLINLDYEKVRGYFKKKNFKQYLGDLAFYIRIIKS